MKTIYVSALLVFALGTGILQSAGAPESDSKDSKPAAKADPTAALQGKWKGKELGRDTDEACYLIVKGKSIEFRGANPNEWYKGTFSVKDEASPKQLTFEISECGAPEYNGKTGLAIYQIENGVLKIAGNRPGNPNVPASFDAEGARLFEFKAE